jgi:LuxR family maltose regulon positive regulatory protein
VYYAFTLLLSGHPLDAIEARLKDAAEADTAGSVCGEVAVIRALIAAYQQETSRSVDLSRRALELLPEESLFFRSFVTGYLALNYLYSGDVVAATQAFEEAVRVSQQVGNLTITVLALCHLAELVAIKGQFYEAQTLYKQALELSSDDRGQRQPIAGLALIGLGHLLDEWNDLEAAKRHLTEGIGLIKNWGEVGAISGYIGLARVRQAQGNEEGARAAIQTAETLAAKFDAMKADDEYVAVHRARLWIAQGNIEAASDWVKRCGLDEPVNLDTPGEEDSGTSVPFSRAYRYALSAQVYVAQGHPDRALDILDPLLQAVETAGWTTFVIRILILKALAHQAQGEMAQAMNPLARALSLAEPGGLVRTFIREGTPMERLLQQARAQGIAADYVPRLLTAFEAETGDKTHVAKSPTSSPLIEPLTERELEVLRLLTTRLSTTEMAEELFISVNTVRSHIRSIYSKLDVHSRREAVAREKQLDLL